MPPNQGRIKLLQAEVADDDQSFFRLLVDGQVKYLTIEPGLYPSEDMCFGPSLVSLLPEPPAGDWNDALVAKSPRDGQPHIAHAVCTKFSSIRNAWHPTRVDYSEITVGRRLRTGVYEVTGPMFSSSPASTVLAKFARFDWEIGYLKNETTAYQWIEGQDIGPRFLGHLTEDGGRRVIGFLIERIWDARHAGPDDLEGCQRVLSRLHGLRIRHGDINRFNFLATPDRTALIDFDTARRCEDQDALCDEMEDVAARLLDPSTLGGGGLL